MGEREVVMRKFVFFSHKVQLLVKIICFIKGFFQGSTRGEKKISDTEFFHRVQLWVKCGGWVLARRGVAMMGGW